MSLDIRAQLSAKGFEQAAVVAEARRMIREGRKLPASALGDRHIIRCFEQQITAEHLIVALAKAIIDSLERVEALNELSRWGLATMERQVDFMRSRA